MLSSELPQSVGKKRKRKLKPGKRDREKLKQLKAAAAAPATEDVDGGMSTKDGEKQPLQLVHHLAAVGEEQGVGVGRWNFEVDYNDHFETPLQAYRDLVPWLEAEASNLGKTVEDLVVYDPYFCQGSMVELITKNLGIKSVINENKDFYEVIARNVVPNHDVLVTNPPYSGEHKTKLLNFLLSGRQVRSFALLLPAYCATKSYWKNFTEKSSRPCFYAMPKEKYEFAHPEGTGKETSPFYSCWFLGNSASPRSLILSKFTESNSTRGSNRVTLLDSPEEMGRRGFIRLERRLNPKQRKKMRKAKKGDE